MTVNLPTKWKIALARWLYRGLRVFLHRDQRQITRSGIIYSIDLAEGIDLSLFVFGGFQRHVVDNPLVRLDRPCFLLDIGANIGSMSLALAQKYKDAKVISFEPTDFAAEKFRRNMALNPALAHRIELVQVFLSDEENNRGDLKAYASWQVGKNREREARHPIHCGTAKSFEGVPVTTLDLFCATRGLGKVGLIKIDTDGHEYRVLSGAKAVIATHLPYVIFEVGQYVMEEAGISFEWYLDFFAGFGYRLVNIRNNKSIDGRNWQHMIPRLGTLDVLCIPEK